MDSVGENTKSYHNAYSFQNNATVEGYPGVALHCSPFITPRNYIIMGNEQKPLSKGSQEYQLAYSDKISTSLRPAHIISPCKRAPEGYICVGRVVESPTKHGSISQGKNGVFILNEDMSLVKKEFPLSFNPRRATNMPSKEKVSKWIDNVPLRIINDDIQLDCYPAVPVSVSSSEASMFYENEEDMFELQCRKITRCTMKMYTNESEPIAHFEDYVKEYEENDDYLPYEDEIVQFDHSFDNYYYTKCNQPTTEDVISRSLRN